MKVSAVFLVYRGEEEIEVELTASVVGGGSHVEDLEAKVGGKLFFLTEKEEVHAEDLLADVAREDDFGRYEDSLESRGQDFDR